MMCPNGSNGTDFLCNVRSAQQLATQSPRKATEAFWGLYLNDHQESHRILILHELAKIPVIDSDTPLVYALSARSEKEQQAAIEALVTAHKHSPREVIEVLLEALRHPYSITQINAAKALAAIQSPDAIAALTREAEIRWGPEIRKVIIRCLSSINSLEVTQELCNLLRCGEVHGFVADTLMDIVADERRTGRQEAVIALAREAYPSEISCLKRFLETYQHDKKIGACVQQAIDILDEKYARHQELFSRRRK